MERGSKKRERGDLDLYKVGAGDQAYARAALNSHLAIGVETCAPRAASTPLGVRAGRVAAQYLTRAMMTSSSKGRTCSMTWARAERGLRAASESNSRIGLSLLPRLG